MDFGWSNMQRVSLQRSACLPQNCYWAIHRRWRWSRLLIFLTCFSFSNISSALIQYMHWNCYRWIPSTSAQAKEATNDPPERMQGLPLRSLVIRKPPTISLNVSVPGQSRTWIFVTGPGQPRIWTSANDLMTVSHCVCSGPLPFRSFN